MFISIPVQLRSKYCVDFSGQTETRCGFSLLFGCLSLCPETPKNCNLQCKGENQWNNRIFVRIDERKCSEDKLAKSSMSIWIGQEKLGPQILDFKRNFHICLAGA